MEINQPNFGNTVDQFDEFLLRSRGDKLIRINISRNTLIALIFSLLVHGLFFIVALPHIDFNIAAAPQPTALEVSLAPPTPPKAEMPVLHESKVIKSPPKVITQKSSKNSKPSKFSVPNIIAVKQLTLDPSPKETNANDGPTDMASYVKAQQAKRNALEADAAKQNAEAVAREIGASQEKIRDDRIKNNLKVGTNGIFEITSLSGRHAAFAFKGWTNDYSNARRESFEVEASSGQDVRLVMIKKMISLIRRHYDGDFNWESQRLGREIVKSARLEDSAELEEFMMMEFFGSNYKTTPY